MRRRAARSIAWLAVFAVPAVLISSPAHAATVRVPADQPTIQAGIDAAFPGDLVLVAPGTYVGTGNTNIDFNGKDIEVRSEAGALVTIIDGGSVRRGFHFHGGEGRAALLDGFTIRNCVSSPSSLGSAIRCSQSSSPTILNCRLTANLGSNLAATALSCDSGAAPAIHGCHISENRSTGMQCYDSSPLVTQCTFYMNAAQGLVLSRSSAELVACRFERNSAPSSIGGGVLCLEYSSPTLTDCVFDQNTAFAGGGFAGEFYLTSPTFYGCVFSANSAYQGGAAYFTDGAAVFMARCTFLNNSASAQGGALEILFGSSSIVLLGSTFCGNAAPVGACIHMDEANPGFTVARTIFAFSTQGEAVFCQSAPVLSCCDIFGNAGGDWTGCIASQSGAAGNLSLDPLFCDAPSGDLRLELGSPCAPGHSPPGCELIGAWPAGCGATGLEATTWGRIKAGYR